MPNHRVLLLGMEESSSAAHHLTRAGHSVTTASDTNTAAGFPQDAAPDVVFFRPSREADALEELRRTLSRHPDASVVLVCSKPNVETVMGAWRAGAADIVFLPLTPDALDQSLQRAAASGSRKPAKGAEAPARFRYTDATGKECWVAIPDSKFRIGRSEKNDLVLAHPNVSRSHAEVNLEDGAYLLRDLGSKHGTFVNGVRVEQAVLQNGDLIRLGGGQAESLAFHQGDLLQALLAGSGSGSDSRFSVHGFREMAMLLSTFRALSSIPLLDDLLNLVVDNAIELTGAERGVIMLKEKDGSLQFRCARNDKKQVLDASFFQTSRRVPDEVFRTGRRIMIQDLDMSDDPDSHSSTRRLGVRSISCVPLRYLPFRDSGALSSVGTAETIGVLYIDSASIGGGLSQSQVGALDSLASEAAMAIYNARLYKESQAKRKMEEELSIAHEIQQALLPARDKRLPFVNALSVNLPCREVGGDYFDYFDLDAERFGFALGDVAGKGMPAALLAAMLHGVFCAQTLMDLPLPAILSNVNCSLARRGVGNRFVTFFMGILNSDGTCTYTNAGHNPPLLVRPGEPLLELTEGGMVLGLFPKAEYKSGTVRLQPGDHLVLFTDGVLEALDVHGEEFGTERLHRLLQENARTATATILQRLQDALDSFAAGAPQYDDITMMVLGYQEAC